MEMHYDRAAQDMGNIVALEHVNVQVPDQGISTLFHVSGLGLTRDPYLMTSVDNMWINIGRSQFHLPTGEPQVLRGCVGLVVPDLEALGKRLDRVKKPLKGTEFAFEVRNDRVDVTSPWGNRIRCHAPDERFGRIMVGMPYVQFDVPVGAAKGIAAFYTKIFRAPSVVEEVDGATAARVPVGIQQDLVFRETDAALPQFDGHHIQIYIVDFSGPHSRLAELGLITREDSDYQYRFQDIVDPKSRKALFAVEHEVRSMTHPLYARPLVNRNPDETLANYMTGREEQPWTMPISA